MMKKFTRLKLAVWIAVTAFTVLFSTAVICTATGGILQVTVEKEAQNPIQGITVYLFNENGTYLNQNQVTDSAGNVQFNLSEGTYKIRADYLGYQFWSQVYSIDGDLSGTITIAHQDVTLTVQGEYQGMQPLAGLPVYLFTESGAYQSQNQTTDGNGQVVFNLPEQSYKVRTDYLGQQFWSDPFNWQNTPVTVPMADAEITVTGAGLPLEGVNVYVFSSSGSYLSMSDTTGSDGKVIFHIPAGAYKFRADYQSSQYWSNEETLTAKEVNPISISTGGGTLAFTVLKEAGNPLSGVNCYVFNETGTYLGMTAATDSNGQVAFNLSDGSYKIRVDYLGYQFWRPIYSVTGNISETYTIPHQDVTLTVQGEYQGMQSLTGVPVYLFTESGVYQGQVRTTNANGQVFFNLPEQSYKVRADYLGQQFWSDPFTWQNTPVTVPMADAEITVTGAGLPLEGVSVYVFSSSGSYLSMSDTTDSNGKVIFRLPAGAYKFRADYQSSHYWSNEETLIAGQVNPISISTGGGTLTFTVLKGPGNLLAGVNGYVFSQSGTYLGMTATTDSNGQVVFNLSDGSYKIRVDYLGYQFWSQVYSVTGDLSETLTIAHQDVTITVQGEYQGMQPLSGIPVYLFTESGAYQSQNRTTDANGHVVFNLPEQSYKVRADYLGQQFWSDPFTWQNTPVTIDEGMTEIHITRSGADVDGARVYLFSETGSYLSRFETTDATGKVQFRLPSRTYKFRADEGSDQAWSFEIQITAGTVNNVSIDFSPVSVIISADPETIHVGQTSNLTWSSNGADSAAIDQGVGSVPVSGSTIVTPAETTTYTITVTGTQGSAVTSTTVTVTNNPPVAANDFVSTDEDTQITAIAVLSNDTDPDGDTLSIDDFTQPTHGTAGSNGDGTLTYTPALNYNGTDSFTYAVSDGNGGIATASVNITINPVNNPPVANYQSVTLNEDETASIILIASDADGDTLTYQIVPKPSHGTLTGTAPNITYTPAENYNGSDAFTFRANDGTVDSNDATVTITVNPVNDPPMADAGLDQAALQDSTVTLDGSGSSDIDDGTLAYNWTFISVPTGSAATLSDSSKVNPAFTADLIGTYEVRLIVNDGTVNSAPDTVMVNIFALPTVDISANPLTILSGESSTLTWTSTNADTCVIEPDIGSVALNGSITVSPTETTIYTITATGPGGNDIASVTITVSDSSDIPVVSFTSSPEIIEMGGSATLTWSSANGQFAYISNGIGIVPLNGSTTVSPTETTTYTITVAGPSGIADGKATTMVSRNPISQPTCSFGAQYENLIPADSSAEYYDPKRFAVISGFVQGNNGFPLSDVAITIHGYPQLGTSFTNSEGHFSIPVEGGETLTLVYNKEGFITAHRQINVPVNDFTTAETIRMIAQDPVSTNFTFDENPDTAITHQSTALTDEFGSRSCSMIFTGDNSAWLVDEDGNDIYEPETISIRASEFTTQDSMPANLPANSAYTYCAEISIDGTQRVRFDKPVITWVNNFLGFDVGEIVPVGYYDRDRSVWVPSENGVVVKLLDTDSDGIVDALDADGDDQPDDLNTDGLFSDEVTGLNNNSYTPSTSFMRFRVTHTAPWGCNWPFAMPTGALLPNAEEEPSYDGENCPGENCTVIHQDIPITDTDITLHYSGNRVEGYHPVITVPVSGPVVPPSLNRIVVKVHVAGRIFEQTLNAIPDQAATFEWDGLDFSGMPIHGSAAADVRVGFVYNGVYTKAGNYDRAFAQSGRDITGISARQEMILWKRSNVDIHRNVEGENFIAKGWTLSTHHQVNCIDPSWLYKGDGSVFRSSNFILDTLVGGMMSGLTNDGVRAIQSLIGDPGGVDVDVSGNLFYPDVSYNIVRKVNSAGWIYTVAGVRNYGGCDGDGAIATEAHVQYAQDVAVDRWGNIYIADSGCDVIRKIDPNGIITTVAGNGTAGYGGDGGAAIEAMIDGPRGITVDDSGNLYISDYNNQRIRKVDTGGIITTVAGNGTVGYGGNGGLATEAMLNHPRELAIDSTGNIYIADEGNYSIRKIDISGIITTVAGNGSHGISNDGVPATSSPLRSPKSVAVDSLGNIYIAEYNKIRKVGLDGILTTITYDWREYGDDEYPVPVTGGTIGNCLGLEMDSRKNIYFADFNHFRILKLGPAHSFYDIITGEDIILTDHSGFEHVFTSTGKQLRTINPDSESVIYEFSYNSDDNLMDISNGSGIPIVVINRNTNGEPASITAPDGTTIALQIDSNSHLTRATYPDGGYYAYGYTPDGLITSREVTATGAVAGLVTDASTGTALSEVTVTVTDSENIHTASTSTDGTYSLSGVSPGDCTIAFEKPGYIQSSDTINIAGGQTYTYNTQLAPLPALVLTITSPEDGAELHSSPITVTGTASHDADVTVNGVQATVVDNYYSAEIDLSEGPNTITVTAVDIYNRTETAAIQVTLTYLAPTAGISADPETVLAGESSTLSWTSTYADTAVIDQGIGSVPVNGTITVSPAETTIYTLTVTGPGGTATAGVTVNVTHPIPTVSIGADPGAILAGETSTLTWTSTNADTCVIEPGIGSVALNGTTSVSPTETTTYTITTTGTGGSTTDSVTVTVTPQITLTITSPTNGLTINRPDVMVQGTIINAGGNETGVTVNGIVSMVYGNQFVANHVPLQEGENTITATTTDTAGNTASDTITVNVEASDDYITVTALPESGISPLETRLSTDGTFSFTTYSRGVVGPGSVELLESSPDRFLERITGEGIYYFTVEVTDGENNIHTDTVAVVVLDQTQLDQLLKAKWDGMKAELANQEIEKASNYFTGETQDLYKDIFEDLYDQLPQIAHDMQDIQLIFVENNVAKYRIRKNELYGGQNYNLTYYIYFVVDGNGLWKIHRY